jgi:hypothetical protein
LQNQSKATKKMKLGRKTKLEHSNRQSEREREWRKPHEVSALFFLYFLFLFFFKAIPTETFI